MDMPHKGHTTITIPKSEAEPIYRLAEETGVAAWRVVEAAFRSFKELPRHEIRRRIGDFKEVDK